MDDLLTPRFEQPDVLAVAEVSAEHLQNWVNRGTLRLSEQNPGSGRRRLYSAADVSKLAIMGRLSRFGVPAGTAAHAAELIVSELVRRGEIEWQLHLAFRASRDEPNAFKMEIVVSNPLMKYNPQVGDARNMRVNQFTEPFEGTGFLNRRDRNNDYKIDPEVRDRLARQGIHAEPALIFPVGEIVNAVLLRLADIAEKEVRQ